VVSALAIMPAWGSRGLAAVAVACLGLSALLLLAGLRQPRRSWLAPTLFVAAALLPLLAVRGGLHGWVVTPGWRLLWAKEGPTVTVSIEESPAGLRRLRTNNNFSEGGDAAGISQIRQGMLPTLFAPEGASVLALGVGSGIALAGTVAGLPGGHFEAVELIPDIRHAVSVFSRSNGDLHLRPNVRLVVADARTWVAHMARTGRRYDLVVGDLFHAAQAGTGALYAREHFQAVRDALATNGVYCQWLPLHEAPPAEVRTVVRTFFRVFPEGAAVLGSWSMRTAILGLLGSQKPVSVDFDTLAGRMAAPKERHLRAVAAEIDRLPQTAAAFVANAARMRTWAGDGPDNSDDRPELELGAPLGTADNLGADNLMALLPVWRVPDGIIRFTEPAKRAHVAALQAALKAFFRGSYAWLKEDLARAERELRHAREISAEFPFVEASLRNLAGAWRLARRPDRSDALLRWLDEQGAGQLPHP
jgi:spermidine synthase